MNILELSLNISFSFLIILVVKFKDWLKRIEFNWNELRDCEEEFRIFKSNALIGKRITFIYLGKNSSQVIMNVIFEFLNISVAASIVFLSIFLVTYFEAHIIHIAISLNKSRSSFVLFTTCHFFELYKNNYFGIILLNCYYVFVLLVFLNRDILFINTVVHICGLYKIAR